MVTWIIRDRQEGRSRVWVDLPGICLMINLTMVALPARFAVCRLAPEVPFPSWDSTVPFLSITRTAEELTVVCPEESIPLGSSAEAGWRCLHVAGPLDFSLVGILAAVASPLAEAGIPVFAISTFNTDYLLVKDRTFDRAVNTLRAAGHEVLV